MSHTLSVVKFEIKSGRYFWNKAVLLGLGLYLGFLYETSANKSIDNKTLSFCFSVKIIMDRDTGRPKGFAFLTFENSGDAQKAIDNLNDTVSFNSLGMSWSTKNNLVSPI